ncbi:MAG: hypothetical protein AB7L91_12060 [Dehalococcoidia bacterium]
MPAAFACSNQTPYTGDCAVGMFGSKKKAEAPPPENSDVVAFRNATLEVWVNLMNRRGATRPEKFADGKVDVAQVSERYAKAINDKEVEAADAAARARAAGAGDSVHAFIEKMRGDLRDAPSGYDDIVATMRSTLDRLSE